ncbi:permease-like cell division protein FtsX [Streptomyces sp. H10-C2]|uniref:permease-like cell division protein FtsX n=1 Tax=unclassified Streptomyces TaxID=2593676 RepID=UPI0024B8D786|nr:MULTISPECIES: permease-like cell division protein FtsX [unclassified Streptomyces]MDJ0347238.1 permease-like cell division protein FtsX [Streptomyces sp. PH10-H1]MDJ0375473.1 permease-like cell division protein FtsX [Streptomyces sp. H10-C2]
MAILAVLFVPSSGGSKAYPKSTASSTARLQRLVAVFLTDGVTAEQEQEIRRDIEVTVGVFSFEYVSRQQSTGSTQSLPPGIRPDMPSAYFLVRTRDAAADRAVRSSCADRPGVQEVKTSMPT